MFSASTLKVISSEPAQASLMPVVVRSHGELEDHHGQVGHRLVHPTTAVQPASTEATIIRTIIGKNTSASR